MRSYAQKPHSAQKPSFSPRSLARPAEDHNTEPGRRALLRPPLAAKQSSIRDSPRTPEQSDAGFRFVGHALKPAMQQSGFGGDPAVAKINDPLEHEAEEAAGEVMRIPRSGSVEGKLQKKPSGPKSVAAALPGTVQEVLRSPGQPLDSAAREFMEPRFGRDFSEVRVHADSAAAHSAQDIQASAYTIGRHIVFGAGRYLPQSPGFHNLLAHELAHLVQQDGEEKIIQRAPANYPSNAPITAKTDPKSDPSAGKSKPQLSKDDLISMLVDFRHGSPDQFVKELQTNENLYYRILKPYGFRGCWTNDQGYLDDFDAAARKWRESVGYSARFATRVSMQRPKSREEQRYEQAQFLVRDFNRHGYTRGDVNRALESAGLLDDLKSHGFKPADTYSTENSILSYQPRVIEALMKYIDRYKVAHNIKTPTSANVPTQGEDVEFYRAWLEGLSYIRSSLLAAEAAELASKFTSDPKKITAAAGAGAAVEGIAGAFAGTGRYSPKVVGPRDRPAAVGAWRYTGEQPIKPAAPNVTKPPPAPAPKESLPPEKPALSFPRGTDVTKVEPPIAEPPAKATRKPTQPPSSATPTAQPAAAPEQTVEPITRVKERVKAVLDGLPANYDNDTVKQLRGLYMKATNVEQQLKNGKIAEIDANRAYHEIDKKLDEYATKDARLRKLVQRASPGGTKSTRKREEIPRGEGKAGPAWKGPTGSSAATRRLLIPSRDTRCTSTTTRPVSGCTPERAAAKGGKIQTIGPIGCSKITFARNGSEKPSA